MTNYRPAAALGAGLLVAALAGCASSATSANSGQIPTVSKPPTSSAACVTDPASVATAELPTSATQAMPTQIAAELDTVAWTSFAHTAAPGAVVVVQTPQGTWKAAYGEADAETGRPMSDDVYHRIGSVTKTFTGTLILQLAAEGKLDLDDPVNEYLADIPNGDTVTLRNLLNMTSGIANYTADDGWQETYFANPHKVWNPDDILDIAFATEPLFAPGEKFHYSNTNTVILGKVLEKVTGQPVRTLYKQRILEPLELSGTSFPGTSAEFPEPRAQGYTLQPPDARAGDPVNATDWNPSWMWTAGGMISTASDLLVYGRALGTGQGLLGTEAHIERLSSFPGEAGYGLGLGCVDGWVGHTGELPGYNTSVFYDTTADTTVVVLANSDIPSGDCPEVKTTNDHSVAMVCAEPATRIFVAISKALGHTFTPPAKT